MGDVGRGDRQDHSRLDTAHSAGISPRYSQHLTRAGDARTIAEFIWAKAPPGARAGSTGNWVIPILRPWANAIVDPQNRDARRVSGGLSYDPDAEGDPWASTRDTGKWPDGVGYQRLGIERLRPGLGGEWSRHRELRYFADSLFGYGYTVPGSTPIAGSMDERRRRVEALHNFKSYDIRPDDDGVPRLTPRVGYAATDWTRVFPGETASGVPADLGHALVHKSIGVLIRAFYTAQTHDLERLPYQRGPRDFPAYPIATDLAQPADEPVDGWDFVRRLKIGRALGWIFGEFPWCLGNDALDDLGGLPPVTKTYDWIDDPRFAVPLERWLDESVLDFRSHAAAYLTDAKPRRPEDRGQRRSIVMRMRDAHADAAESDAAGRHKPRTGKSMVGDAYERGPDEGAHMEETLATMEEQRAAGLDALRADARAAKDKRKRR